jgi:hypothetical protein
VEVPFSESLFKVFLSFSVKFSGSQSHIGVTAPLLKFLSVYC